MYVTTGGGGMCTEVELPCIEMLDGGVYVAKKTMDVRLRPLSTPSSKPPTNVVYAKNIYAKATLLVVTRAEKEEQYDTMRPDQRN
ncbi:hypothetical protein VTK73DRAFT_3926 [Phialemonium thermophilum]|uniref:Uncharacterized protein n=1 Tax=Phialemonium thermophilum TaxID=223376 RepID=A0ABR3VD24_9PEZI